MEIFEDILKKLLLLPVDEFENFHPQNMAESLSKKLIVESVKDISISRFVVERVDGRKGVASENVSKSDGDRILNVFRGVTDGS